MNPKVLDLKKEIEAQRNRLLSHPVYSAIRDLEGLRNFAQIHVFAVWDFMSLLKSLQISLTSVSLPWMPVGSAQTRYLINEIVLGEESDLDENDIRMSHFELYIKAMEQMGADTSLLDSFLIIVKQGENIFESIEDSELPENIQSFLNFTFDVSLNAPAHIKAAVFTFGREDLIPSMFHKLLKELYSEYPEKVSTFKYYIERHIEVDGDHHSQLAIKMVEELCGEDENKWNEACAMAKKALQIRYKLWDTILDSTIQTKTMSESALMHA
ncbi:MAG: DUF3050 domain-containing protein [Sphingobacteriia bacterium]|jgi:hypothetical protein